ncbi:MAG: hypothetical protein JW804_03360 [Sedimentisphaerales bacterium]|nr:hypothetical protein [Sedimentisphaerales bacterium]
MSLRPISFVIIILSNFCFVPWADTFTNHISGQIMHGYPTSRTENNKTVFFTVQKGFITVDPEQWNVEYNHVGRGKKVVVIELNVKLDLKIVTEAISQAIISSADRGPLFILLEINSPGGSADYVEKICDTIIRTSCCPVYAYVKTGRYGGALGGAAAVALACDKLYMAQDTTIGAAYLIQGTDEKLSIAWQQYLQSLAQLNGRPGLLARAMVDKDVEIIEIEQDGRRRFITSSQKDPNQTVVRLWSKKGSLLTLTAAEAVQSRVAEGIADSREELLRNVDVADAEIVMEESVNEAMLIFKKAKMKFDRLRGSLDVQIKMVEQTQNIAEAVILLRQIKEDYKSLLLLAKRFGDLYLDVELIEEQLGNAETYYKKARDKQRRLDANSPGNGKSNANGRMGNK